MLTQATGQGEESEISNKSCVLKCGWRQGAQFSQAELKSIQEHLGSHFPDKTNREAKANIEP